jgi:hypothetical protein
MYDCRGEVFGRRCVVDQSPVDRGHVQCGSGPLEHGHGDGAGGSRTDRLEHFWAAECGRVALSLQLEAVLADTAGYIYREHELHRDYRGCGGGTYREEACERGAKHNQNKPAHLALIGSPLGWIESRSFRCPCNLND